MPPRTSRTLAALAALALLAGAARAQTCFANVGTGPNGNAVFDVGPAPARPMNISSASQCTCGSYASASCCTDTYVTAVKSSSAAIYKGWSFDQCGRTMGASCRAYMQAQECSFGCDPSLSATYFAQYNDASNFQPINLCGSYCDAWFEACKNELTCSSNWQTWFIDPAQGYVCNATPVGAPMQPCKTIGETFGNGRGLCGVNPKASNGTQGMWGTTYSYAADNKNWCVGGKVQRLREQQARQPPPALQPPLTPYSFHHLQRTLHLLLCAASRSLVALAQARRLRPRQCAPVAPWPLPWARPGWPRCWARAQCWPSRRT